MLPTVVSSIAKRFFFGANTTANRGRRSATTTSPFSLLDDAAAFFFSSRSSRSSSSSSSRRFWRGRTWEEGLLGVPLLGGGGGGGRTETPRSNGRRRRSLLMGVRATTTRSIFIQTQTTPNPSSLMFLPGKPVLPSFDGNDGNDGNDKEKTTTTTTTTKSSVNFSNAREALERKSPLATRLFQIDGVTGVFFGRDFVTVTKSDEHEWEVLKAEVFAKIMDFYASGEDAVRLSSSESSGNDDDEEEDEDNPNRILETDSETVAMIKELLETRIKPAVAEDGGDIAFKKFDEEEGVVYVQLRGACDGCPSSTVTLKSGIENMLMHYVPEVKGVVPWEGDKEMDLLDMADLMRGRS